MSIELSKCICYKSDFFIPYLTNAFHRQPANNEVVICIDLSEETDLGNDFFMEFQLL